MTRKSFDVPIVFLLVITMGVVGVMAIMSWFFVSMGWTGPLGLVKGGVAQS